jgi:hypothetical protein
MSQYYSNQNNQVVPAQNHPLYRPYNPQKDAAEHKVKYTTANGTYNTTTRVSPSTFYQHTTAYNSTEYLEESLAVYYGK